MGHSLRSVRVRPTANEHTQTMEVAVARVYNWDVVQKRKEKEEEEKEKAKAKANGKTDGSQDD